MKLAFRIVSFIASINLIFIVGISGSFMYSGGSLMTLVVVGFWIAYLSIPFGAAMLTYGLRHALWGFAGLSIFLKRNPLAPMQEMVLQSSIRYVYATGILGTLFGCLITMGAIAGPKDEVGEHFAHSMVAIIYAVIISEFILRPALKRSELLRLEQTTGETHPSFKKLWFPTLVWGIVIVASLIALGIMIFAMIYQATHPCH